MRPQGQKSKYYVCYIFSFILLIVSGGPNIHSWSWHPNSMLRGAHGFGWKHVWAHGWGHSKRYLFRKVDLSKEVLVTPTPERWITCMKAIGCNWLVRLAPKLFGDFTVLNKGLTHIIVGGQDVLDSCVPSLIATCEFPRFYPTSRYGDLWLCGTAFFLFTRGFFCEAIFFWMWVNCSNICHVAANGSLAMQSSKMALLHTNPLGKMLQFTHIEWIQQ